MQANAKTKVDPISSITINELVKNQVKKVELETAKIYKQSTNNSKKDNANNIAKFDFIKFFIE